MAGAGSLEQCFECLDLAVGAEIKRVNRFFSPFQLTLVGYKMTETLFYLKRERKSERYRDTEIQRYRGSEVQRYRETERQRDREAERQFKR